MMSDRNEKAAALAGICLSMVGIVGCAQSPTSKAEVASNPACDWNDLGQGVYTFPMSNWPESLVQFRKEHAELVVTAIYADNEGAYGRTDSVVVVTETRDMFRNNFEDNH